MPSSLGGSRKRSALDQKVNRSTIKIVFSEYPQYQLAGDIFLKNEGGRQGIFPCDGTIRAGWGTILGWRGGNRISSTIDDGFHN